MCTPSLAIDAIIEVHHTNHKTRTTELQKISRKECFSALKGRFPGDGVKLTGFYSEDSTASAVRLRASAALRKEKGSSYSNINARNLLQDHAHLSPDSSGDAGTATIDSTSRALKSKRSENGEMFLGSVPNRNSSGTLPLGTWDRNTQNSRDRSDRNKDNSRDKDRDRDGDGDTDGDRNGDRHSKYRSTDRDRDRDSRDRGSDSNISLVLVFRRDPPSGFAIPGGDSPVQYPIFYNPLRSSYDILNNNVSGCFQHLRISTLSHQT